MSLSMQELWDNSPFNGGSQEYLEHQYSLFLEDPELVETSIRNIFLKIKGNETQEIDHNIIKSQFKNLMIQQNNFIHVSEDINGDLPHKKQAAVHELVNNYRLFGHLYSDINPLNKYDNLVPELELACYGLNVKDYKSEFDSNFLVGPDKRTLQQIHEDLRKIYCRTIASEYMYIPDSPERIWVQSIVENTLYNVKLSKKEKCNILEGVVAAEGLEKYLGAKYPGAKRFSLEGCDSFIVGLEHIIQAAGVCGIQEIVLGMAHRGRLNVLINILGKNPKDVFDEFEGKHSLEVESGDVKYHQGFSSDLQTAGGNVHLSLAFNPSHLEIVNPVICGAVRARQARRIDDGKNKVLPIAIHGDSSIAGQGVVMESFSMSQTTGYGIGGTIHVVINNQVGFTTSDPLDTRSTLYCSDIGKMIVAPIFHVNANDPEAVYIIFKIALEYRNKFHKDVIIDLIGYRRLGHNEADEPSVTQPLMYQKIRSMPTVVKLYTEKLITEKSFTKEEIDKITSDYKKSLDKMDKAVARNLVGDGWKSEFTANWSPYTESNWRIAYPYKVDLGKLKEIAVQLNKIPDNITLHSRVKKIIENREKINTGEELADWGYAENLAYASLLMEGHKVRLSGQDCGRGTFFHRHAVLHDQKTGEKYIPLSNLHQNQAHFTVIDSLLSEAAVLAFDYGFSCSDPKSLIVWEAQFGDFANSAQVVIDQFISSGEQKWGRLSGITMLLPHGYEGQGPEHSSARLERYLQLCAEHNIQVCIPSTPAQIYHLLRRQVLRPMRKPLIAITPKSLLRHKEAVSSLEELSNGQFQVIIKDTLIKAQNINRVILCSGKIYYELKAKREEKKITDVAIIRIEQLYPFPEQELTKMLQGYSKATSIIWCQEEPKNQGAWYSTRHHLQACLPKKQELLYAGRDPAAAPAVGYAHLHKIQQEKVIIDAFGEKYF